MSESLDFKEVFKALDELSLWLYANGWEYDAHYLNVLKNRIRAWLWRTGQGG